MTYFAGLAVFLPGGALAVSGVRNGAIENRARVVIGAILMGAGSVIVSFDALAGNN